MSDFDQAQKLNAAIAGLEAQRETLGGAVVDAALAALRLQAAQLEQTESVDERKLVTIVFSDISGFTALAEKEDPERVRELINACFDRLVPMVQKYEGTIDKFIGDEIMALFGAPIAHEDDAERALRTALEMMEALVAFNREHGTSLELHFGINTGPVVAGEIGGQNRRDYSVMGDPVNLAARLEEASSAGEIFVGPTTYRLTSRIFEFEVVPPLSVKGKKEPIEVHRLIGLRGVPRSMRGIEGLRAPLMGRDAELATLREAMLALTRGVGNVLAIIGEAGLGKSRLLAELRVRVPSNIRWAEGRALSYTGGMSYWLAQRVVLSLLGQSADAPAHVTAEALRRSMGELEQDKLLPYLARMLDLPMQAADEEEMKYLTGEALQSRILEAVREFVCSRALQQPLILVWEDLHWCDPSSKQVLKTLRPLTGKVPLLILSAARPEGKTADLDESESVRIRLSPLTRDESSSLIQELLQIENLPARTRDVILGRAEGNPFFLEELLRALIDVGVVVMEGGRGIATNEIESIDIPETVQGVLAARIDRLSSATKRALQLASVIGRVFPRRVLAHLYEEGTKEQLDRVLVELREREFVHPQVESASETAAHDGDEYTFKHAITQEVAYGSILLARRKKLHLRIAQAIEQLFPERLAELSATLGFHFDQAESNARAVFYLRRAADSARTNFANSEAISFYKTALRHAGHLLDVSDDLDNRASIVQLSESLGDVSTLAGEQEQAWAAFGEALTHYETDDAIGRSRLHRKIGACHSLKRNYGESARAFDQADAELDGAKEAGSSQWWEEKLQIQLERMHLLYWQERVSEMRAVADAFEGAVSQHGTPLQQSTILKMLALSLLMGSRLQPSRECVELGRRAVQASASVTDLSDKSHTVFVLGLIQLCAGAYSESVDCCSEGFELANRVGNLVVQTRCINYRALAHRRLSEGSAARADAEQTLALASKLRMVEYIAMAKANLAWVAWKDGRLQDVEELGEEALALWHGMEDPLGSDWIALWPLIAVALEHDNFSKAIDSIRGLLAEGQYPLADAVMADCRAAIDCSMRDDREALRNCLDRALQTASAFHYL